MQVSNFYDGFYTIIQNYVYGGSVAQGSFEEMTCVIVATFCALSLIALPFVALYCAVKALIRLWRF